MLVIITYLIHDFLLLMLNSFERQRQNFFLRLFQISGKLLKIRIQLLSQKTVIIQTEASLKSQMNEIVIRLLKKPN